MDEQAVRAIVRQAVARLQSRDEGSAPPPAGGPPTMHVSHYRYVLTESDGPCLIEPTVQCTHCGYCQSHGH